jgi:hypothetical protein
MTVLVQDQKTRPLSVMHLVRPGIEVFENSQDLMAKKKVPKTRSVVTAGAVLCIRGIPVSHMMNSWQMNLGVMAF